MNNHRFLSLVVGFGCLVGLLSSCQPSASGAKKLQVVAAENFYGDMVSQIGGTHVQVLSIVSDPNVDPHEYESNVADSKAVATADLVIANGAGYDDWMDKLLAASPNTNRVLLKGFDLAPNKLPENEHVWYDPANVRVIAQTIADQLQKIDAADTADFAKGLEAFNVGLDQITTQIKRLNTVFAQTPIGLTETIFLYQAKPLGLKILTPFEFQKAIAEGNDPPAEVAITAQAQVTGKKIRVLVYNAQTVTPATTKLQDAAKAAGIPTVPVTETMPPTEHYQSWMLRQLGLLETALRK
jgi:zinc/manganese transport system substrate-binding protein